jgi:hypothetical protein
VKNPILIVVGRKHESPREVNVEMAERVLEEDYPVYVGYLYVCDGEVISSDVEGTIKDLRRDLRDYYKMEANVITSCDIFGRRLQNRLV